MKMLKSVFFSILLMVPLLLHASDQTGPIGWASVNTNGQNGTTGGEGGEVVTATTMNQLVAYAVQSGPLVIQVEGMIMISPKGRLIEVRSDKTIIGAGAGSGISQGGFRVGNSQRNIVFKNLTISDTYVEGDWDGKEQDWDGIQIKGTCHHIWIDHCTFLRQGDGAVDITNGANYVTVSNCFFGANNKASLIGNSDTDSFRDRYKVTMHHNWFHETTQRHPRVRFGMVHLFNNYYYNMGGYGRTMNYANSNGYGIGVGVGAQIYSENNHFEKVVNPTSFYDSNALPGFIIDIGSHFINSGSMRVKPEGIEWNPADFYEYALDPAEEVKDIVMSKAGAEQVQTSVNIQQERHQDLSLSGYPNPFIDRITLVFFIPGAGTANITIHDLSGRTIRSYSEHFSQPGNQEFVINRGNLKNGIYSIRVQKNWQNETIRILAK